MRIAAVNWSLDAHGSVKAFFDHMERLLARCEGADLVVMPELCSLEILGEHPTPATTDMPGLLADELAPHVGRFAEMARKFDCTLVGGSHFVRTPSGVVNTAIVAWSDGRVTADVPKVTMTRFEADEWGVVGGTGLRHLDAQVGVTVCYDCEFPESGHRLAESGVLVQAVPAFTESRYGFQRVRWSCHARAIENQILVVHASLVGDLGAEPVPSTFGSSAIVTPSIEPFPETAVLAETWEPDGIAIADVDLGLIELARRSGDVRNWADRSSQDWSVSAPTFVG
ncbi:MAG: hypothetical protein JSS66_01420 [Armatimonadetes bacterium]|nr:hypothetical protein [Armatimonadota bacterium]